MLIFIGLTDRNICGYRIAEKLPVVRLTCQPLAGWYNPNHQSIDQLNFSQNTKWLSLVWILEKANIGVSLKCFEETSAITKHFHTQGSFTEFQNLQQPTRKSPPTDGRLTQTELEHACQSPDPLGPITIHAGVAKETILNIRVMLPTIPITNHGSFIFLNKRHTTKATLLQDSIFLQYQAFTFDRNLLFQAFAKGKHTSVM